MAIRPKHARSACRDLSCGEGTAGCSLATESIEPKPALSMLFFVFSVSFVVKVFSESLFHRGFLLWMYLFGGP